MSQQRVNNPSAQPKSSGSGGGGGRKRSGRPVQPSQIPSTMSGVSKVSQVATTNATTGNDSKIDDKKKKLVGPLKIGSKLEGSQSTFLVKKLLRNPGPHAEYLVMDEDVPRIARLEPLGRKKMKFASEILIRTKNTKAANEENLYVIDQHDYFEAKKTNVLIIDGHGLQLYEIHKAMKTKFTPGCVLNIAFQTLEAIRILHVAGFVNRNIKPATFSIGLGEKEKNIYLSDFRITRVHIDDKTKGPREPRKKVEYIGTMRYASIAAIKELDQGRKDDLESWVYMIYDLYDPENGLPWRTMAKDKVLQEKEKFKNHESADIYKKIPEEFKKLVDLVFSWKYESVPDYRALKDVLTSVVEKYKLDTSVCDWAGKINEEFEEIAILGVTEKSANNRCSGEDDFEFGKKKKKKPKRERKIMSPNDVIKNGPCVWKVISVLGSGGFGDVYKVFNVNDDKNKHYALKTESEDGKKMMLRLKVEMQVMIAISDARKKKSSMPHFVEFVDRGKSEELKSKFIVMSLVGPSLDDCRKKYKVDLSNKSTPWTIAIQTLQSINDLHSLGFLHRDIKPANFAVGLGADEKTVYMLDFGICRSFLDLKTKEHRAPRKTVKFLGTLRFASRSCMKCQDQGRKDDLECWLYMMFDIMDDENGIPWKTCADRDKILCSKVLFFDGKIEAIYRNIKKRSMEKIVNYVDKLEYQSLPDYEYLRKLLIMAAESEGCNLKRRPDWVGKLKSIPKNNRFSDSDSEDSASAGGDDD